MRSYIQFYVHLIWSTKNREPLLDSAEIRQEAFAFMSGQTLSCGSEPRIINGVADHVHCLLKWQPSMPLKDVVQKMKGGSSFWLNKEKGFDGGFGWQDTYGAFSVSPSQVRKVEAYIRNQEKRHQQMSFADEMKWLRKIAGDGREAGL